MSFGARVRVRVRVDTSTSRSLAISRNKIFKVLKPIPKEHHK